MKSAGSRVLTINGGSSSIKFALFEVGAALRQILGGELERIELPEATLRVTGSNPTDNFSRPVTAADHTAAVGALMEWIEEHSGRDALAGVGHRVVHNGPKYRKPQQVSAEMVEELHRFSPFTWRRSRILGVAISSRSIARLAITVALLTPATFC
jgi:acetate kinase